MPNLLTTTTTLMVAWMGAGAASRGIRGACCQDQMKQVLSIDRRKWSYMEATNPWLLQPSMDSCQGGCRRSRADEKCEFPGPAGRRTVTVIKNPRRQYGGGNGRPHRTSVFDFLFRAPYAPQLVLESVYATRPT